MPSIGYNLLSVGVIGQGGKPISFDEGMRIIRRNGDIIAEGTRQHDL